MCVLDNFSKLRTAGMVEGGWVRSAGFSVNLSQRAYSAVFIPVVVK